MKIILTNDDGIDAPGLEILQRGVQDQGEIVIVAPAQPQSGIGHKVTTWSPIAAEKLDHNHYAVDGTPADCSRLALKQLVPDADWLIAGINPGANLGSDVYNSGTVAAAREAAILGCRSIAISQYVAKDQQINWDITGYHAAAVLKILIKKTIEPAWFWNVNLPHPINDYSEIPLGFCGLDTNPHKYDYLKKKRVYLPFKGLI